MPPSVASISVYDDDDLYESLYEVVGPPPLPRPNISTKHVGDCDFDEILEEGEDTDATRNARSVSHLMFRVWRIMHKTH
jgi:hypothetical protein